MSKHIGIVGVSAEGAALCYRTLCVEGSEQFGPWSHPEVTLHTHPLGRYMPAIDQGAWNQVAGLLLSSATKLAQAGAELLICPDNTVHEAFDLVAESSPLPWLHIAAEVATAAAAAGYRRVGVLGTRYLMKSQVYPEKLSAHGIAVELPASEEREEINKTIFQDLVYGRFPEAARSAFVAIIGRLAERGCQAVVLGCTEIPLLIGDEDSPLPTLDSTRLLARAALREAAR